MHYAPSRLMPNQRDKQKGNCCLLCGSDSYEHPLRNGRCPICGLTLAVDRSEGTVAILPGNASKHVRHRAQLSELLQICDSFILDLSGYDVLELPASSSLTLLSSLKHPRRRLMVVADSRAQRELRITRVDRVFDVFDSLHDALTD